MSDIFIPLGGTVKDEFGNVYKQVPEEFTICYSGGGKLLSSLFSTLGAISTSSNYQMNDSCYFIEGDYIYIAMTH
jgi:hypothetical protein